MKKFLLFTLLCLMPSFLMAAQKLPKGVYRWSEFETAKKESIEDKKPMLYVYTSLTIK